MRKKKEKQLKKQSFACPQCSAIFSRKLNRDRHVARIHTNANLAHVCTLCGNVFTDVFQLKEHRDSHEPTKGFVLIDSAFNKNCVIYRKKYGGKMKTLEQAFANDVSDMRSVLEHEIAKKRAVKASIVFQAEFLKPLNDDLSNLQPYLVCLRTTATQLLTKRDIKQFAQTARKTAQERIDDFIAHGSGWTLNEIVCTDVQIGACPPLNGSCSLLSIRHGKSLKRIKVSSKNKNQCFYEAIAFHFIGDKKRKNLKKFIKKNICKINPKKDIPVKVSEIKKFERENSHLDCAINVLFDEDGIIFPLRISKNKMRRNARNRINLLLYSVVVGTELVNHYAYVEDLNLLLRRNYRGPDGKLSYERSVHCVNCLQKFADDKCLLQHQEVCMKIDPQRVELPKKGAVSEFNNHIKKYSAPYIGFFDFEASQTKPKYACAKCEDRVCSHRTVVETVQEPITYSMLIIETATNKVFYKKTYSGEDCASHLIDQLLTLEDRLEQEMTKFPKYYFTREEREMINNADVCHICEKEFYDGEDRVGDHCHSTGILFGAAHNLCNLNRRVNKNIPMFCHNLQGYDSHFIMQCLKKDGRITNVKGLAYNSERFRTITLNIFVFLDSLAFLHASLSELVNDLSQNKDHPFDILDQLNLYNKEDKKKKALLIRKGVYPYESVTGIQMLIDTRQLPPKEDFYSSLTNSSVSEKDYEHARKVFNKFKCVNLLVYTELYCATDVALLAEVMLQFRLLMQNEFQLDCCHYVSTPQMAYDSMLKSTSEKLDLLTEYDQVLFVEQNIRGK